MPAKRLRGESGYSLVEVMVAIMIMAVALLPMPAMFDMGLHSTTVGSNYDRARMLANMKLEEAKNLPYNTVRDNFPEPVGTPAVPDGSGYYQSAWKTEPGADFANLQYRVEKQYMAQPSQEPTDLSEPFEKCDPDPAAAPEDNCDQGTNLIRVTVTVGWGGDGDGDGDPDITYTTHGLVAQ